MKIIAATAISAALALIPMPFHQWGVFRVAGAAGALTGSVVGYCDSKRKQQQQLLRDRLEFDRQQKQRAIEAATAPIVAEVAVKKLQKQAEYALADHADDMQAAYVDVMLGKYGEAWLEAQKQEPEPEPELETKLPPESELKSIAEDVKTFAAKKAKLMKFLKEHEGGWILQCMKKPILIYGDQGSGKSYFAEFLALCRHYLRGHEIVSIADPHFHQNRDYCWQHLIKLGVKGYGANHNYQEVNSQILAMYDRFTKRTLKDTPITSIFDEVTRYKMEEHTKEAAAKLGSKLSSDPRKANESPIVIAHADTLNALGGAEGFAEAIRGNFIIIKLNSNSEQQPLWRGTISGIKDEEGETIANMKISIAPDWIRSSWVYDLFNSDSEPKTEPKAEPADRPDIQVETPTPKTAESDVEKLDRIMQIPDDYWLQEFMPEKFDRLTQLRREMKDNLADNPVDNQQAKLAEPDKLIQGEIKANPASRKDYPDSWDEIIFARMVPDRTESELFAQISAYLDNADNPDKIKASEIIQKALKFTKSGNHPKSYLKVGKPCFKYLIRKYAKAETIAKFQDYLDKD
ncbi:MAG: ATP-binding protein [Richelia sp. CSU_2_1]|nr:ATP-binding protein [Richelia sp. CSU_2_1]